MIDKEKGLSRYRVVRGVPFSLYLSLVSRLVLGGVFLYDWSSKIFGPGGLAASIRFYEFGLPAWFVTLSAYALPSFEVLPGL